MADRAVAIPVEGQGSVSGLLRLPDDATALYVLAHGAGGGMEHPFMSAVAGALSERRVGTLRYQFPYMERGGFPPDRPPVAAAAVRAAVETARVEATTLASERGTSLPLLAGGKSFGGRMTAVAAAEEPLPDVNGLVFLGFPLHPADRPATDRAERLPEVTVPMLFVQGTRDRLADLELLRPVIDGLGDRASLHVIDGADHSFAVPKRAGRNSDEVIAEIADAVTAFVAA